MIVVRVQDHAFDSAAELAPLAKLGGGAVASFAGIARADDGVIAIELEHYPAMTQSMLEDLATNAFSRWQLLGCVVIHRVGIIKAGDPIVLVGTASAHRAAALEACSCVIDTLKTDAPFWKKEHSAAGSRWVEPKVSDEAAGDRWR
jgi:molybdopterin synthase catalytic subunit